MIKEIRPEQLETERERGEVLIILGDVLYTEEEFWDSARVLIDYEEDDEPEEEDDPDPVEEEPKKRGGARRSKKEEVLTA